MIKMFLYKAAPAQLCCLFTFSSSFLFQSSFSGFYPLLLISAGSIYFLREYGICSTFFVVFSLVLHLVCRSSQQGGLGTSHMARQHASWHLIGTVSWLMAIETSTTSTLSSSSCRSSSSSHSSSSSSSSSSYRSSSLGPGFGSASCPCSCSCY